MQLKKDQRGASMSVFACGAVMALLILAGLLVDGAAQMSARQRAVDATAQVARFATDAAAPYLVDGQDGTGPALAAAQAAAARYSDLTFTITMKGADVISIEATTTVETTFLQLIGVPTLRASGTSEAILHRAKE